MAEAVYLLCALASLACAGLLARAYAKSPSRLLLFSSICFACLAVNSVLLVLDRVVWPTEVDLRLPRVLLGVVGLGVMLWALVTQKQ